MSHVFFLSHVIFLNVRSVAYASSHQCQHRIPLPPPARSRSHDGVARASLFFLCNILYPNLTWSPEHRDGRCGNAQHPWEHLVIGRVPRWSKKKKKKTAGSHRVSTGNANERLDIRSRPFETRPASLKATRPSAGRKFKSGPTSLSPTYFGIWHLVLPESCPRVPTDPGGRRSC